MFRLHNHIVVLSMGQQSEEFQDHASKHLNVKHHETMCSTCRCRRNPNLETDLSGNMHSTGRCHGSQDTKQGCEMGQTSIRDRDVNELSTKLSLDTPS